MQSTPCSTTHTSPEPLATIPELEQLRDWARSIRARAEDQIRERFDAELSLRLDKLAEAESRMVEWIEERRRVENVYDRIQNPDRRMAPVGDAAA